MTHKLHTITMTIMTDSRFCIDKLVHDSIKEQLSDGEYIITLKSEQVGDSFNPHDQSKLGV